MSKRYRAEVKKTLSDRRLKSKRFLGRGFYSSVYSLNSSRVFKVYEEDCGYQSFLDFLNNVKYKKHLPRVYDTFILPDNRKVVVLERLTYSGGGTNDELWTHVESAETSGYYDRDASMWHGYFGKSFDKTLTLLAESVPTSRTDVEWDLHADNIMFRKNRCPVIIDPWA